ncbi:Lactonase, 7-bladed beta-propeller-domain-containing protein [Mycena pura]|uniref:Lactonase, 7-bladed beta-propeller-domain-containing protein n=1 Tax=Mycena pura TaxID=153505 RepID=A0AAD6UU53_9AGAR|nr:Lactonase, 7-bladed beta-propeller-domain-containing protein [Mycena pura]
MVKFTIYTGGYTSFVVSYLFDTQAVSLTYTNTITTSANLSWLTQHPQNQNIIYAVNEVGPLGALQSYSTSPGGGLTLLDEVSSGGNGPAFCAALSTGQVAVMNYGSGDGEVIPTTESGNKFDNSTSVLLTFPPPVGGITGMSNPHMAVEHGREVFVPDLGASKIWRIGRTGAPGIFCIHGQIEQPLGSGPRHMAILDNFIYLLHERSNTVTKQAVPAYPNGTSPILFNVSTLPADRPSDAVFAAAEILLPPPTQHFPYPYVYASNRFVSGTQDPRGDTIAIFDPRDMRLVQQVYTGLEQIRGMEIGPGDVGEQYLVALGAVSGGMVVYKRKDGGAALEEVARNASAVPRTTLVFVKHTKKG